MTLAAAGPRTHDISRSTGWLRYSANSAGATPGAGDRPLPSAFSGGLDSTVLLHALVRLADQAAMPPLRVVHVDHGCTVDSPRWARALRADRDTLRRALQHVRIDASVPPGSSPEAAARKARYAALARRADARRGATDGAPRGRPARNRSAAAGCGGGGLRGLAAMPRSAPFAAGWHWRPLLGFQRAELQVWAATQRLEWLEDPANLDLRFDRSYLRHAVLPRLRTRWPGAAGAVARMASYAADAGGARVGRRVRGSRTDPGRADAGARSPAGAARTQRGAP